MKTEVYKRSDMIDKNKIMSMEWLSEMIKRLRECKKRVVYAGDRPAVKFERKSARACKREDERRIRGLEEGRTAMTGDP